MPIASISRAWRGRIRRRDAGHVRQDADARGQPATNALPAAGMVVDGRDGSERGAMALRQGKETKAAVVDRQVGEDGHVARPFPDARDDLHSVRVDQRRADPDAVGAEVRGDFGGLQDVLQRSGSDADLDGRPGGLAHDPLPSLRTSIIPRSPLSLVLEDVEAAVVVVGVDQPVLVDDRRRRTG